MGDIQDFCMVLSELKINIIWEVDDQMNELAIKANEFSVGLRQR